jgi:hypothetical protein
MSMPAERSPESKRAERARSPQPSTAAPEAGHEPLPPPATRRELGGRDGPEPTRFGDWEKSGRCIDF